MIKKLNKKFKNFFNFEREQKNIRTCLLLESKNRSKTCRYEAYGLTRFEALENLTIQCKINGLPNPQLIPQLPQYHCGTFEIFSKGLFSKSETVYNTIFWKDLPDLKMCFMYCHNN